MTIHSLRVYGTKLSAAEVGYISSMMKTKMDANFIASFDGNTTITVGGSATAWAPSFGGWDLPSSYVDTLTGKGIALSRNPKVAPYVDSNCSAPFGTGSYTIAIQAQLGQTDGVIWGHGKSLPYASAFENYLNLEKQGNKVVLTRGTTTNFNDRQVVCTYDDANVVNDGEYHTFTIVVENTITDGNITATSLTLYVDGESVTSAETTPLKIVTGGGRTGFQIGNTFGASGGDGATGTIIDEVYGWNRALNASEVSALCALFPIPENVAYIRTIDANADWFAMDAWTLDGTSTVASAPAEGKDAKITATADATLTVNAAANVENFTTAGAGTLTIASDGTNKLTVQKTQIEANTIVNEGAASFGTTSIASGKILTVKDTTTISALSGTGVYDLDLGATTADGYIFAADGKNYKVSSGTFTDTTLQFSDQKTTYEFAGGEITTKRNDNGVGQFSFGAANVKISGGTINATHLVTVQGGGYRPTTVEQTGGKIILSGTGDGSGTAMDSQTIMFGHWPNATSTYELSGGSLEAENGGLRFGNDSASTMTISNEGLLKVKGIKGKGSTTSALTVSGGKLSLGDWGFAAINYFTFTAEGGEINAYGDATINQSIALNGNVTLSADAGKTLTIFTIMGTGTLTIAGEGTVALSEAVVKTIPVTVAEGAALKVIPTMDAVVLGKITLAEGSAINGTVAVEGIENVTIDGETISFTPNATITGSNWWWDYEFNGSNASIGSDTGTMSLEGNATSYTTEDANGNQELYFQKTPYRGASFASQDAFTAVMYCQPGNYNNVPLVGFGTLSGTAVILATGDNAANGEMQILLNRGNSLTSLADNLIVPNATTAKHLYAFTYDVQADKTVISVYVDGKLKKVTTINEQLHVSNGFQIGSVHGGVCTGLTKYPASGDAGTIDFLRVAKGVLSAETMTVLAKAYPYVSEKGIAQRTITDATATWVADASWTQKVPNADDATQAAPNEGTMVELTTTSDTQVSVSLNLEADASYETLTIAGSDVKLVAGEYGKKIVAGDVTIDANVTIPYGVVEIGTLTVNTGTTLTFDFSAYDFASVWADRTISLTGLATVADGAEVTATIPETLPVQIQSATLAYNGETQEYALVIEVVEGELTGTIADDGDWDSITWKKGEVNVTPSDFAAMESVNLTVSADATLTMNKAITLKNLTISGDGALIIAKNDNNKLIVSGATTINAHVTATASASALGSIIINTDKSLTIKERIGNVGTIASNAGELVYAGDEITENTQLQATYGAIRIAAGRVKMTSANGNYTGMITIDEGATLESGTVNDIPFTKGAIVNNGTLQISHGVLPPVSGSGNIVVAGDCNIGGVVTTSGALTINEGVTATLWHYADDFADVVPAINGPSVVVATGASIVLGEGYVAKTSSVTIPVGKSVAGAGAISTILKIENGATLDASAGKLIVDEVWLMGAATEGFATKLLLPEGYTADTPIIDCATKTAEVAADLTRIAPVGYKCVADGNTVKLAAIPVAKIGDVEYATLQAAVDEAEAGAEITVIADIVTAGPITVNKKVTVNLNSNTITASNDTEGNGVFYVVVGGDLTLEGEGAVNALGPNGWCMAVWADGGKVIINGGTYTNEGAQDDGPDGAHFDLIYVKNGGEIEINGGTFKCETPRWTLNSHNTNTGTFVVKGGSFYQYNPTDFDTDEAVTTWCAANYRAEADGEWYVVKEGYTLTVEKPVVTVQTQEAADAVQLNVVPPENLTADEKAAYLGYFEKKITANAEGGYTVELALKDEVKPVIAETTPAITFNEDGTVTVNIENELPGLYYGVRYATTVEAVESAKIVPSLSVTPAEGDTAGFFKVVVDFNEIK